MPKTWKFQEDWEKKVLGSGLADRVGFSSETQVCFFLPTPQKIRLIIISICFLYTVLINFCMLGNFSDIAKKIKASHA